MEKGIKNIFRFSLLVALFSIIPVFSFSHFPTPEALLEHAAESKRIIRSLKTQYKLTLLDGDSSCSLTSYYQAPDKYKVEVTCPNEKLSFLNSSELSWSLWNFLFSYDARGAASFLELRNILAIHEGLAPLPIFKKEKMVLLRKETKDAAPSFKPETLVFMYGIEYKKFLATTGKISIAEQNKNFVYKVFDPAHAHSYFIVDMAKSSDQPSRPSIIRWLDEGDTYELSFDGYFLHKEVVHIPQKIRLSQILSENENNEVEKKDLALWEFEDALVNVRMPNSFFDGPSDDLSSVRTGFLEKLLHLCYR
ncbi:MAG: hypothetical protein HYS98_01645 [Deltaproteobacteria bacterium]|nr:hypothetical protein [Deltaproteobacteria bacterium]